MLRFYFHQLCLAAAQRHELLFQQGGNLGVMSGFEELFVIREARERGVSVELEALLIERERGLAPTGIIDGSRHLISVYLIGPCSAQSDESDIEEVVI